MFEEEMPRSKIAFVIGQKLDELSIAEFDEAIQIMRNEVIRLEHAREKKAGHLSAAAGLFAKKQI